MTELELALANYLFTEDQVLVTSQVVDGLVATDWNVGVLKPETAIAFSVDAKIDELYNYAERLRGCYIAHEVVVLKMAKGKQALLMLIGISPRATLARLKDAEAKPGRSVAEKALAAAWSKMKEHVEYCLANDQFFCVGTFGLFDGLDLEPDAMMRAKVAFARRMKTAGFQVTVTSSDFTITL